MLLRESNFMPTEGTAPLLMQNHRWLEKNSDIAWKKTRIWTQHLLNRQCESSTLDDEKKTFLNNDNNNNNATNNYGLKILAKPDRIIVKDADRTFLTTEKRQLLITLLSSLKTLFNDYQQTMSYVSGILLLFFDVHTVFEMMFVLGRSPTYNMSGYWRAEAVAQGVDAYVLFEILKKLNPKLYNHLSTISVLPDTFIQKWFGGLAVQVMPIKHLIDFWTQFFKNGFRFLFKFMISLLRTLTPLLLRNNIDYKVYEILRLDRKTRFWECVCTDNVDIKCDGDKIDIFFTKVLSDANSVGNLFNFDKIDFHKEREYAFNHYLMSRFLNAANKVTFKGFEIDEDENGDDEFKDCEQCDDGFADFYCNDCQIYLCDECQENPTGDHALTHAIKDLAIDNDDGDDNDDTVNID